MRPQRAIDYWSTAYYNGNELENFPSSSEIPLLSHNFDPRKPSSYLICRMCYHLPSSTMLGKGCLILLAWQHTLSQFIHLKFCSYRQTIRLIEAAEVAFDRQHIGQSGDRVQAFKHA